MELRDGSKLADVGVIPEDWDCSELDDFITFISYGFTNPMPTTNFGPYMVTAADINDGRINFDTARCTSSEAFEKRLTAKSRPRRNDVLLTKDGALGRVALVNEELICINQSVAILRPNNRITPGFLARLLQADHYQKRMIEDAGGSTIKHIYITIVNRMPIAVPKLKSEQEDIAAALSDADELIASLDALIAKKRDLKQAAMQQLLTGKTRLPGFTGDWEVKRLAKIASIRNEKINTLGADVASFCVELEQIGQNTGQIEGYSDARSRRSVKYRFRKGDVLFGRLRPYLRKFWHADCEGVCSTEIWPLIPFDGQLVPGFLFQTVQTEGFIEAANSSYGTHMPRSDWKALTQFEVLVPSDPVEQSAIAEVLADMDAERAALEAKAAKARALKQGMMRELLTGRIRLV